MEGLLSTGPTPSSFQTRQESPVGSKPIRESLLPTGLHCLVLGCMDNRKSFITRKNSANSDEPYYITETFEPIMQFLIFWGLEKAWAWEIFLSQGSCQVNNFSKKVIMAIVKSIVRSKIFFKAIVKSISSPKFLSKQLSSQLWDQKKSSR